MSQKKVLHVTYGFNGGGVGVVIVNYCATRPMDGIHFSIVGEGDGTPQMLHTRMADAGFDIHYIPPKKQGLRANIRAFKKLLDEVKPDAVHVHFEEWNFLYLYLAKRRGVKVRISHAHTAYASWRKKPHYAFFRRWLNRFSTLRIAVSRDAGDYLYGKHPYTVLNNAIDASAYRYDPAVREEMRASLGVADKFVICDVGRLTASKDPLRMLEIFSHVRKKCEDAHLLFVGIGELENAVKDRIAELGLADSVTLLGQRHDVPRILQAADAFALPTHFEGLGIVYVEAQAAGLHSFATADVVPLEATMDEGLMHYIPLDAPSETWADTILQYADAPRRDTSHIICEKGYDLSTEIDKLASLYHTAFNEAHL